MIKIQLFFLTLVMLLSDTSIASVVSLCSDAQDGSEFDTQQQQVLFLEFPDVVISNILSRLSFHDTYKVSITCHTLKDFVADNAFIARNFFSKLSSWQQDEVKRNAATISEKQLTAWVNQFTDKEQTAGDLIKLKNRGYRYFPHVLWHTISKLMVNCSKFILTQKSYLSDLYYDLQFSADSCYVVCRSFGSEVIIWGQDKNNGEWIKQSTIPYHCVIKNVCFQGDTSHVLVEDHGLNTIWGLDTNREWCKKITFVNEIRYRSFDISGNCRYIVTTDSSRGYYDISIWRLGPTGQLTDETVICEPADGLSKNSIYFSSDGTDLVCSFYHGTSSVWGIGVDGKWVKKAILSNNGSVDTAISANGSHILTESTNNENNVNIWSKQDSGNWVYTTTIPTGRRCNPKAISSDGTHVVLSDEFGRIKICSLRTAEEWIATDFTHEVVSNISFSSDNLHLVLGGRNGVITVWGLGKDKEWTEKARIDNCQKKIRSISFSPNGRLISASFFGMSPAAIFELRRADSQTLTLPMSNVCECAKDLGADSP
ncbi:MAG: hypothetical protein QS748_06965 [Candidatus Endonucleobacter bathymodioli]|uniref:F-box domain-containing protein n=1 Tax=Candidatus Endonucleibacter bathymodioli TaxID=539814 RepID=A0AA90NLU9_9GAMM|nr:hypothetical protein [Candidatus Endonucleobacter bathymodioli]